MDAMFARTFPLKEGKGSNSFALKLKVRKTKFAKANLRRQHGTFFFTHAKELLVIYF